MRTGLLAQKVGMTRLFTDDGAHVPVTVLKLDGCQVVAQRTKDKDGYSAVQLGAGVIKVKNVSKAMRGHFAKASVEPKRKVVEFRVSEDALIDVGAELSAAHFVAGQLVDVSGTSLGKGFAGVMKRHNFKGMSATHGTERKHRTPGSIGSHGTDRGHGAKIKKGKRMAGHLGDERVTVRSLDVVKIDAEKGLLLVKGPVPGANDGYLFIRAATRLFKRKSKKLAKK